jgi:pimeloyl-ACP methyl ester carboxylesterase
MSHIREYAAALFTEPTPLSAFSALDIPILYMTGSESPASSRSVARLLLSVLPRVQHVEFDGIGHMGPVTHPDRVNDVISRFLESNARPTNS